jgi:hypothetical protein
MVNTSSRTKFRKETEYVADAVCGSTHSDASGVGVVAQDHNQSHPKDGNGTAVWWSAMSLAKPHVWQSLLRHIESRWDNNDNEVQLLD